MASEGGRESHTPIPTTEADGSSDLAVASNVTAQQWQGMQKVLNAVYDHRTADGYDPSKVFHRKVNKRVIPSYYEFIKEPIALSIIKAKLNAKEYKDFKDFVRDFALIPHNAFVFNRSDSGAYQDAVEIKTVLEAELKKLVESKAVLEADAKLPYLGEIPPQEDAPQAPAEEEEEEDDDDDDDDEGEESDDSKSKPKRGPGRPKGTTGIPKRDAAQREEARLAEIEARRKRGRPPRVDTPTEARIKNIMKGMRRFKDSAGHLKIRHFDRLPDKLAMPDYFVEIRLPMAVDVLKKKLKRKKYQSVEQFMKDVDQMFDNAKLYNEDESAIYKDAVHLQKEAHKVADEESAKPDSDFAMDDGRLPLPGGINHNGEVWKVGDWVHLQNPNDLTNPIPAQIYRTWRDASGINYVNACWYYRPSQTIHRFDKHFLESEVVKTGQYRDHEIDEIVDRCFVMFVTRYNKGRPRHLPQDKDIYVCESRYNEDKHTFNKIKTWASCVPDEVRDKDYEMEIYREPKKMKKQPSPIAYLLKDEQRETDELPKPQWGSDNAPPKIGAVHRRPRDPKESPPPEPTPSPPPQPPPQPSISRQPSSYNMNTPSSKNLPPNQTNGAASNKTPRAPNVPTPGQIASTAQPLRTFQPAATSSNTQRNASNTKAANWSSTPTAAQPRQNLNPSSYAATQNKYPTSAAAYTNTNYQTPQPVEVWKLQDSVNSSIPPDIRSQFQCDEQGHILFFTAPPLDVTFSEKEGPPLGHSARFLAETMRRDELLQSKRKRHVDEKITQAERTAKAAKTQQDVAAAKENEDARKSFKAWEREMAGGTQEVFRYL